ncbi:MAG: response regulator [Proteobacteria bacterium]|jgi:CheY-like chemotaxis protein|nr:response regulator [Pseudomonadota bacterium]
MNSLAHLKKTILVLDDSPEILTLDRILLEGAGYEVLTCLSSDEAFELLQTRTPHLIILDYHLGEMTGNTFIELLREQHPELFTQCPIVFHSALDHIPNSLAAGHIAKFSDMQFFLKQVTAYLQMRPS